MSDTDAQETTAPGIFSWLENILKIATAGVGLVAAIGLPAVAIHLVHFGVPVRTASYEDVLRAGVLPAAMLVLVGAYCAWGARVLAASGWRKFIGLNTLFLSPLMAVAYLALMAGLLSYILIIGWSMLWVLRWIAGRFMPISVGDRTLLEAAAVIMFVSFLLLGAVQLTHRWWKGREGPFWRFLESLRQSIVQPSHRRRPAAGTVSQPAPAADAPVEQSAGAGSGKSDDSYWWMAVAFPLMFLLMLYCIKGLMYIWDPRIGAAIRHSYVVMAAVASGIVFALFFAGVVIAPKSPMSSGGSPRRRKAVLFAIAAIVYLGFEAAYSTWGYPRLPSGLGGGRPDSATLWLTQNDDGQDIAAVLTGAQVTNRGKLSRVDGVFILLDGSQNLVLTDHEVAPAAAVLVNKSRVASLAW